MKRFISVLLSAIFVFSLIPAAYATTAETDTIKYEFTLEAIGGESANIENAAASDESWNGVQNYQLDDRAVKASGVQFKNKTTYGGTLIKINVGEAGKYIPTLTYGENAVTLDNLNVYLIKRSYITDYNIDVTAKDGGTNNNWNAFVKNICSNTYTDLYPAGTIKQVKNADVATNAENAYNNCTATLSSVQLDAGDNYLVFTLTDGDDEDTTAKGSYAYINSLTLTKDTSHELEYTFGTTVLGEGEYETGKSGNMEAGADAEDGYDYWQFAGASGLNSYQLSSSDIKIVSQTGIDGYMTFKIKVDKSGAYAPTVNYTVASGVRQGKFNVYLLNEATFNRHYSYTSGISGANAKKEATLLNDTPIDTFEETAGASSSKNLNEVSLSGDTYYYVMFEILAKESTDKKYDQAYINSLTLRTEKPSDPAATEKEVSDTVSFAAVANIEDADITGIDSTITSVNRGSSVTLTAPDVEGYKFVGWKRGSADSGKYLKLEDAPQAGFKYTLFSNTTLTAMYEKEEPEDSDAYTVEYWNGNSELLDTVTVTDGAAEKEVSNPTLIGFEFAGWFVDEKTPLDLSSLTSKLTRAVARYNDKSDKFSVTDPENLGEKIDKAYDTAMNYSNESAKAWKRGEDIVAYGTDYTYYVWDNAEVEPVTEEVEDTPLVVLNYSETHGAYMVEYDKGNALDIAEAGILFGSSEPTVESGTLEKYTSQRSGSHGQLTAKPGQDYKYAAGYIIYRDADGYHVIYDRIETVYENQ